MSRPGFQYSLRFPTQHDFELPWQQRKQVDINLPHLVYRDGMWRLYRNKYKSRHSSAAGVIGRSISLLILNLAVDMAAWKYGGHSLHEVYQSMPKSLRGQIKMEAKRANLANSPNKFYWHLFIQPRVIAARNTLYGQFLVQGHTHPLNRRLRGKQP